VLPSAPGEIERTRDGGATWRTLWRGRLSFDALVVRRRLIVAAGMRMAETGFAWLQFLRHRSDRDRAWRAWLVQVARREAYRLSRTDWRAPVPLVDAIDSEPADPRADAQQAVEVREALELLTELRPRLRPIAFLRATGHSYAQIQEVTGLGPTRVGQLVRRAHDGLWEAAAVRQRAETPRPPRVDRLRALEEDPPTWLLETLSSPAWRSRPGDEDPVLEARSPCARRLPRARGERP
jgi:hypothetical protein